MDGNMIFNLGDANCDLPTTGKAWEILLEHVKENAMHRDLYLGDLDDDDIIQEVRERGIPYENIYGEDATVGELFNDDDIIDHIRDANIPVDAIYDEDDLRENAMVQKMLEDEREGLMDDGWGKVDEKDDEIGQLEKQKYEAYETIAELRREIAEMRKEAEENASCFGQLEETIAERIREIAHLQQSWGDKESLLCTAEDEIVKLEEKNAKLKKKVAEQAKEIVGLLKQMDEIIRLTLERYGRCDDGIGGVFEFVDSDEEEEKDELNSAIDASGNALH